MFNRINDLKGEIDAIEFNNKSRTVSSDMIEEGHLESIILQCRIIKVSTKDNACRMRINNKSRNNTIVLM